MVIPHSYHSSEYRNHGSHFEKAKTAIEEGGGRGELAEDDEVHRARGSGSAGDSRPTSLSVEDEKHGKTDV